MPLSSSSVCRRILEALGTSLEQNLTESAASIEGDDRGGQSRRLHFARENRRACIEEAARSSAAHGGEKVSTISRDMPSSSTGSVNLPPKSISRGADGRSGIAAGPVPAHQTSVHSFSRPES